MKKKRKYRYSPEPVVPCECGIRLKSRKSQRCTFCYLIIRLRKRIQECANCHKLFIKPSGYGILKTCNSLCKREYRIKIATGERSTQWQGGITKEHFKIRNHEAYKIWRRLVLKRDKYTCQDCGKKVRELHVHHIKSFSKYPDLRLEVSNGKALCFDCHAKYHKALFNLTEKAKRLRRMQLKLEI